MALADRGSPNWVKLVTLVTQLGYVTWLSTLAASKCKSAFHRSLIRNVRAMDAFRLNCAGPVIELRPALPHCPRAGAVYAARLRCLPAGALYTEEIGRAHA